MLECGCMRERVCERDRKMKEREERGRERQAEKKREKKKDREREKERKREEKGKCSENSGTKSWVKSRPERVHITMTQIFTTRMRICVLVLEAYLVQGVNVSILFVILRPHRSCGFIVCGFDGRRGR